ncbi:hypothetical protein [Paludibacter sp.]|uniref:hypothetical protein n=1 Tax=Paludibacter sp. TaxID=1898105 RepID=UPI0013557568|nr:hypothetical protein [Paludibacter sp.]MTK53325.1 hypothetical protein [Paludibacter sp.]
MIHCTKCGKEIIGGYYNYPSGILCSECGSKKNKAITRADILVDNGNEILAFIKKVATYNLPISKDAKNILKKFDI